MIKKNFLNERIKMLYFNKFFKTKLNFLKKIKYSIHSKMDEELLELDILINEKKIDAFAKQVDFTSKENNQALEDLIKLYLEKNDYKKAKEIIEKIYQIKFKLYGSTHLNITNVLLLRAKINFHLNDFSSCCKKKYINKNNNYNKNKK
jgi:hypothetical protein